MMTNTILTSDLIDEGLSGANRRLMMKRSSARETAANEFRKLFFGEDYPGTKSVSGTPETLGKINLENMQDLQQRYFSPRNYIISITSSWEHVKLVDVFNNIWTINDKSADRVKYSKSIPREQQVKTIDLGKEQAQIRLGYRFTIEPEDKAAFTVMSDLLSNKLMFDLRETQGLAYSIGMSEGYDDSDAWLIASIGTGPENIEIAISGMKSYFSADKMKDVSDHEIAKTVNSNKGHYMMRTLTRIGQAFYMGYYEYYTGDFENAFRRYNKYDDINPADVRAVADKYLTFPENHTLLIVK